MKRPLASSYLQYLKRFNDFLCKGFKTMMSSFMLPQFWRSQSPFALLSKVLVIITQKKDGATNCASKIKRLMHLFIKLRCFDAIILCKTQKKDGATNCPSNIKTLFGVISTNISWTSSNAKLNLSRHCLLQSKTPRSVSCDNYFIPY